MTASYRKTKIIATLGPATRTPEKIRALIDAGVNVFRLNFSHGNHEAHLETYQAIRVVAAEAKMPIAVLQDLSGPKIRISVVDGEYVTIPDNSEIFLYPSSGGSRLSDASHIFVEGLDPTAFLSSGEMVLLADGIISLVAEGNDGHSVRCRVLKGGRLRSRVGIAFPDSNVDLPATTEKDFIDLEWGIKNKVDYVAISFVQNAQDIEQLRDRIKSANADIRIIAKIERKKALDHIDEIVEAADGLMVARGDLGLELPLEKLPLVQRSLIEKGNHRGIPVIVATQMLHSMITSIRPTRAEVADIATAVMTGADAVMLSEETAIGENPIESVRYLGLIAQEAEKGFEFEEYKLRLRGSDLETVPDAVSYAACAAASKIGARAIVICTRTGTSARLVAKYRPQQPLFGIASSEEAYQRMSLVWGLIPVHLESAATREKEIEGALSAVTTRLALEKGQRMVITGGTLVNTPGSTSIIEIREV